MKEEEDGIRGGWNNKGAGMQEYCNAKTPEKPTDRRGNASLLLLECLVEGTPVDSRYGSKKRE